MIQKECMPVKGERKFCKYCGARLVVKVDAYDEYTGEAIKFRKECPERFCPGRFQAYPKW